MRFADSGPALTAVRLPPGRYRATAMFDYFDEEHDRGGSWLELAPADRS